jgi:hypothetical protein
MITTNTTERVAAKAIIKNIINEKQINDNKRSFVDSSTQTKIKKYKAFISRK